MFAALAVASLTFAADPRAFVGPEAVPADRSEGAPVAIPRPTLLRHQVAADAAEPAAAGDTMPRYHPGPLSDAQWQRLGGKRALVIFGTAGRECVTLTRADKDAVFYVHPKNGPQQAPRSTVTAVHENSWECKEGRESPPAEWARVGAAVGVGFSTVGLAMGILYDVGRVGKGNDQGDYTIKHFVYAGLGVPAAMLGTPIVAIGAASTARDLRVRGKIWARGLGYALYAGSVLMNVLWIVGQYGEKEPLTFVGITSLAGGLGLAGSAFMAVDALASRAELLELQRQDTGLKPVARRKQLRVGAGPIGQGFAFALGGRF
jgi:hypothetical protein